MRKILFIATLVISSLSSANVEVMSGGFNEESITSTCNMMARFRMVDHLNRGDVVMSSALNRYKRICINHWMQLNGSLTPASLRRNTANANINQFRGLCELNAEILTLDRESQGLTVSAAVKDRYIRMCFSKFERLNTAELNYVLGVSNEEAAEDDSSPVAI